MTKKKAICFITLFILLFLNSTTVFASDISINTQTDSSNQNEQTNSSNTADVSKTILEVVDRSICEINLKDMGSFKKELTGFDADKKEVTLTLTVTNTMEEEELTKPIEVYFVLDNSQSMTLTYQNKVKFEYVKETAKLFAQELFEHFVNPQIGIVSFSSVDNSTAGDDGLSLALGTQSDAKLLLPLSNSQETIENTIDSYSDTYGPYTNIEAGLQLAMDNFSDSTESEKYVILISDGVPNLSLDTENTLIYSGITAQNTKQQLIDMEEAGYHHIFSILMGASEGDTPNPSAPTIEDGSRHMTYRELAEEIFGTEQNPTAGSFYFSDYENLSQIVNEEILNSMITTKDNSLKNIVIKDTFPQEIVDNFSFEHVTAPNIGTVTNEIDETDNSITWTIPELAEGQVATLSYKLTLKDNYDAAIIDQILPTNEKVDIGFETADGEENSSSDVSPKVRLKYDDTVSDKVLPQTGNYTTLFFIVSTAAIVIFALTRVNSLKKLK